MTLYTHIQTEVDVDVEVGDNEILEYIHESPARLAEFRGKLGVSPFATAREMLDSMKGLDRDAFLADLARECALLGIDWPSSPKDDTAIIRKDGGK